jgi:hypothetical protein
MPGDFLDLSSVPASDLVACGHPPGVESRRFIGIQFSCCSVYARIYINASQSAYEGRCPRCLRRVEVQIGPGGTDTRFFTAY